jgi:hypothetical protein
LKAPNDTICFPWENQNLSRKIALRSLKNLCTFIGAIAMFSYFYNWTVDLRHWYVTLASSFVCMILWLGFYVIELRGGVTRIASGLLHLWSDAEESTAELPALPAEPPANDSVAEPQAVTAPNPLPWLNPPPPRTASGLK